MLHAAADDVVFVPHFTDCVTVY